MLALCLALVWHAPAACPDLRSRIEDRLGRADFDVPLTVDVVEQDGHFIATLDDTRTLVADTCDELVDAVALIAARLARELPPAASAAAPPPISIEAPPVSAPTIWAFSARASAIAGAGVVPGAGFGAELAVALHRRAWFGELAVTHWLPGAIDVMPAEQVEVGVDAAGVRAGGRWRWARAWLAFETGTIRGKTIELQAPGDAVTLADTQGAARWFAAGAGAGIEWHLRSWLRIVGSVEAMAGFERARFVLANDALVYTPPPMSARASLGLELVTDR